MIGIRLTKVNAGVGCSAAFLLWLGVLPASAQWGPDSHGRNYDESRVGEYTLPDPLRNDDGSQVETVADWESQRRPEILRLFRDVMYGHNPDLPIELQATVTATDPHAVGGLASRTLVTLRFFDEAEDSDAPRIRLMLYLPNSAPHPVPVFLGMSFYGNASVEDDSSIPLPDGWMRPHRSEAVIDHRATDKLRGLSAERWPLKTILDRGYGVATFYYGDVEPDHLNGWKDGVRGYAMRRSGEDTLAPDSWGAIGAWAWGLSRALDYLQTHPQIDGERVTVFGFSRLGKAALWAGAQDRRFAAVISNNSGEGGASLARRNFGENIAFSIAHASWRYSRRFREFIDREHELPFDQHMLISLIAPRPVYISSATNDLLADPKGEFLSGVHAEPVYRLFGQTGIGTSVWPPADTPVGQRVGYHLRTGDHAITLYDWRQFLTFADRHLKRSS